VSETIEKFTLAIENLRSILDNIPDEVQTGILYAEWYKNTKSKIEQEIDYFLENIRSLEDYEVKK